MYPFKSKLQFFHHHNHKSKVKVNSQQTSDLMTCNEDTEVRENESRGESSSSSQRDSLNTLVGNNSQPLTPSLSASVPLILVKLRHALFKMTLFNCKRVLGGWGEMQQRRASKEDLSPPRSSHILTPISILYERDCN